MIIEEKYLKQALDQALENSVIKKEGKEDKKRKFDETLDIIFNLRDVDVRNPNNKIASEILLPHAIRKDLNVCFITDGDQMSEVKKKGFDVVDSDFLDDLNKKDTKTKKKFVKKYNDFIARADLMRDVAKVLGRFLGQSGKMPKPQPKGFGIVKPSDEVDKIIDNFKRRVSVLTKKAPIVQTKFGKKSLSKEQNYENLQAILNFIITQLPNDQGNIKSIYIKTTMGKPAKVQEPSDTNKFKKGGKKK